MLVKPNPLENGMRVYADGVPFIGDGDILEGMRVYANGEDMSPALIYHASTSATWTATLKGPAGNFVTFDWGDGSAPTTLELAVGDKAFIHDFSGGAGTGVVRIYGDAGSVTSIDTQHCDISKVSTLEPLKSLAYCYMWFNNIVDVSPFVLLENLSQLYLYDNNISNIAPLSKMTQLNKLDLGKNSVSDVSALSSLVNLNYLYLGPNNISDVSALSSLVNLTYLVLHHNFISDISPLVGLANLTSFSLYDNNVNYPLTGLSWFTATSGTFNFSSTMDSEDKVDRCLIDLNDALWANCTVYLDGTNPPPTAAAAAAMAGLAGRGVTLIVSS